MAKKKKEVVSVSFHYLLMKTTKEKEEITVPFSEKDFQKLSKNIRDQPKPDITDSEILAKVRYGSLIPFSDFKEGKSSRCVFGTFQAPYTGHSFDNSEKGKISADSVNQRKFHYLLYLSDSGRIYIGSQYLGNYGGYGALRDAILKFLPSKKGVQSHSFRTDHVDMAKVKPTEIKVNVAKKSKDIASNNVFQSNSMIAVKKSPSDENFEVDIKKNILNLKNKSIEKVKEGIAKHLSDAKLFDVADDDILDCTVVVQVNGRSKTIYMLEGGHFATRFALDATLNNDGHPKKKETREKMYDVLKNQIIDKAEDG